MIARPWPLAVAGIVCSIGIGIGLGATAHADDTRDYVVKPGDSCMSIAIRELGDRDKLTVLHALNPWLGPQPHHLKPGQVLKLPALAARTADAHVTAQRGNVEVRPAGEESWIRSILGVDLFREWRVGAREQASAQVTFADASAIAMRANTIVVIYGKTRADANIHAFGATLERGTLRSRLGELDGADIATAAGTVHLGHGSAVVEANGAATTLVSNHAGAAATLTSKSRRAMAVDAGFGSKVAVKGEPTPPRKLLPSPVWQPMPHLAMGWAGHGATVRGEWGAEAGAVEYRIEVARDQALTAVDLRLSVPSTITAFETHELPPGDYFVAVAAVDSEGFESAPSERQALHVVELPVPAGAQPGVGDAPPTVALGTTIELPSGERCTNDRGGSGSGGGASTATNVVAISQPGASTISCIGVGDHEAASTIEIVAAPVTIVAPAVTVAANDIAAFDIAVTAAMMPAGRLVARADGAVVVDGVLPTATGVHVVVHARGGSHAGTAKVTVAIAPARGGADVPIGSFDVAVTEAAPEPVVAAHVSPLSFRVAGGGVFAGDAGTHASRFGLGASVDLGRFVAIDALVLRSPYASTPTGGELGLSLRWPAVVTPALRAGVATRDISSTVGGYAGVSASVELVERVAAVATVDGIVDSDGHAIVGTLGFQVWLP